MRFRDRDAIITKEGIIFRVYGYCHPPASYVCDPEYASAYVYRSENPRALRVKGNQTYYKFFMDEGLKFVQKLYPAYMVWYQPLRRSLVGVNEEHIVKVKKPGEELRSLLEKPHGDSLLKALHAMFDFLQERMNLPTSDCGVFGSLLQGFYHPELSDIDLIIYGRRELARLKDTLAALYSEEGSPVRNEFDTLESVSTKQWKFGNYSLKEYAWHQRRKQIYALFKPADGGRVIKAEFEPVKKWAEITNEYNPDSMVEQGGWTRMLARVTDDQNSAFMPSVYMIEPVRVLQGTKAENVERIVSYVEEFRLQAEEGELVYAEGNLEKISDSKGPQYQIILTYGPRYFDQVLKVVRNN